ncbi:hypothetical protein EOM86_06030 [Candidatus Nomurabacteria bacterium]|nr:hypothetical protein [Candidatus Nomurabacteria bacterium]
MYLDPIDTRMVVQSLNITTKYLEWSLEKVGTASLTTRHVDIVSEMDRISLLESMGYMSQYVKPSIFEGRYVAQLIYKPEAISHLYRFDGNMRPLKLINRGLYSFEGRSLIIDPSAIDGEAAFTIRYSHHPEFYVIDVTREIRDSKVAGYRGMEDNTRFPMSAVMRRCHLVISSQNYWNPLGSNEH